MRAHDIAADRDIVMVVPALTKWPLALVVYPHTSHLCTAGAAVVAAPADAAAASATAAGVAVAVTG